MTALEAMKNIDPRTVDRSTLVQRSSVRLDPNAPQKERLNDFIKQIRNPYCYMDGDTVMKISFSNTEKNNGRLPGELSLRALRMVFLQRVDNRPELWYDRIRSKKETG